MKQLAMILVFLLLAAGFLCGCDDSDEASLEGTWKATKLLATDASGRKIADALPDTWSEMLLLEPDGTFSYSSTQNGKVATGAGRWGISGTALVLSQAHERSVAYRMDGDLLCISGSVPEGAYTLIWKKIAEIP